MHRGNLAQSEQNMMQEIISQTKTILALFEEVGDDAGADLTLVFGELGGRHVFREFAVSGITGDVSKEVPWGDSVDPGFDCVCWCRYFEVWRSSNVIHFIYLFLLVLVHKSQFE